MSTDRPPSNVVTTFSLLNFGVSVAVKPFLPSTQKSYSVKGSKLVTVNWVSNNVCIIIEVTHHSWLHIVHLIYVKIKQDLPLETLGDPAYPPQLAEYNGGVGS